MYIDYSEVKIRFRKLRHYNFSRSTHNGIRQKSLDISSHVTDLRLSEFFPDLFKKPEPVKEYPGQVVPYRMHYEIITECEFKKIMDDYLNTD